MATSWSAAAANAALDSTGAVYSWVQLHIGSPGSAGTSNVATNTTRKQVTWGAASGGTMSNTNTPTWTAVPATETYTHFTVWTLSSGGAFGFSGTVAGGGVTAGNDFDAPVGDLDVTLTLAS